MFLICKLLAISLEASKLQDISFWVQADLIDTVARSALVAWSRLKPIEMIVARCSSDKLSVGVVPAPELQPGRTKGAEKSGVKKERA